MLDDLNKHFFLQFVELINKMLSNTCKLLSTKNKVLNYNWLNYFEVSIFDNIMH